MRQAIDNVRNGRLTEGLYLTLDRQPCEAHQACHLDKGLSRTSTAILAAVPSRAG
jgi:hypothetical protein